MKTIQFILACLFLSGQFTALSQVEISNIFGTGHGDHGHCLVQSADSGYVLGGEMIKYSPTSYSKRAYLSKTDKEGNIEWERMLFEFLHSGVFDLGISNDTIYACGSTQGTAFIALYNINGDSIHTWVYDKTNYPYPVNANSVCKSGDQYYLTGIASNQNTYWLEVDPFTGVFSQKHYFYNSITQANQGHDLILNQQNLVFSGFYLSGSKMDTSYIIKLDSNGDTLWTRKIQTQNLGGTSYEINMVEASDGDILVAGTYGGWLGMFITKLDRNTGDTLWMKRYEDQNYGPIVPYSIVKSGEHEYLIGGEGRYYNSPIGSQGANMLLMKINELGDTLWTEQFDYKILTGNNGGGSDYCGGAIPTFDGAYAMIGTADPAAPNDLDFWFLKYRIPNQLGVEGSDKYDANQFQVYPNPFENEINILNTKTCDYGLYDISGKLLHSFSCEGVGKQVVQLGSIVQPGIYVLIGEDVQGPVAKKIIKK
jgi:hypothetical protein